jgi:uncharacterized cofD-like protein
LASGYREGEGALGMKEKDPNIVLIGGGTGLSYVLKGLKKYPVNITAIVTVGDDGGSSGLIRDSINIVPPGDIRKVMVAMSEAEPIMDTLLNYRFDEHSIFKRHTVGNILLTALFQITGDYVQAIEQLAQVLNIKGTILPVAQTPVTLVANMEDGSVVKGESNITKAHKKIVDIKLENPNVKPTEEALEAIREAELIVFGPGSLYTSIIPNLLIPEIKDAILASNARKMFICNVMTEPGETDNYKVSQHVTELEKYLGRGTIDCVLANDDFNVSEEILNHYRKYGAALVEVDLDQLAKLHKEIVTSKFVYINEKNHIRHKSNKLAAYVVMKLIEELE